MKKNEPLKNDINKTENEKYFHCQKCKSEFMILLFEELPNEIQIEFKLILNQFPLNTKAFIFIASVAMSFQFFVCLQKLNIEPSHNIIKTLNPLRVDFLI